MSYIRDAQVDHAVHSNGPEAASKFCSAQVVALQDAALLKAQSRKRRSIADPVVERPTKILRPCSSSEEASTTHPVNGGQEPQKRIETPVEHWATHGVWPSGFSTMSSERSNSPRKRLRSPSYSARSRSGEVPPAHSVASIEHMRTYGIDLDASAAESYLSDASKNLCAEMLSKRHDFVPAVNYPISKLKLVFDRLGKRNETRIVRDLTPLIVPSAENMVLAEHLEGEEAKSIAEDVGADWTKARTMGGPMPRPDLTVGIDSSAFTNDELLKLKDYSDWERNTLFTNCVYFPFLICEVKTSKGGGSDRASRQGGHAGGIAANAIFQLHRSLGYEQAEALNGQILAFVIAHENRFAQIHGFFSYLHSPTSSPVFYQHVIRSFAFGGDEQNTTKQVRDFVIALYTSFYSKHLKRIRDVLRQMPLPEASERGQESLAESTVSMPPPPASATQLLREQVERDNLEKHSDELQKLHQHYQESQQKSEQQIQLLTTIVDQLRTQMKTDQEEREQLRAQRKTDQEEREQLRAQRKTDQEEREKLIAALLELKGAGSTA